jgi:hypothetical protein
MRHNPHTNPAHWQSELGGGHRRVANFPWGQDLKGGGGRTTNECFSSSCDPRNLLCVGCEQPHHVLHPNKPPVLIFSDQNFVPFLSGGEGENCIAVCRMENPSLSELADLAMEILDRTMIPPGTTFLFGSGSHLFRAGTSQYQVSSQMNETVSKFLFRHCRDISLRGAVTMQSTAQMLVGRVTH